MIILPSFPTSAVDKKQRLHAQRTLPWSGNPGGWKGQHPIEWKIRISKSEIRNNIKWPKSKWPKLLSATSGFETATWCVCFCHSNIIASNLFRISIFGPPWRDFIGPSYLLLWYIQMIVLHQIKWIPVWARDFEFKQLVSSFSGEPIYIHGCDIPFWKTNTLKEVLIMSEKVIIYGKSGWPYTSNARSAYGDDAQYLDVTDKSNLKEMLKHSNGVKEVPVIVIGEKVTIGHGGTWGV